MSEKMPLVDLNNNQSPLNDEVRKNENLLRPKFLKDYIGQKAVAAKLEVFMAAAKKRQQNLDHVLLAGPPGLGKTTLAHIIANEMGGRLHLAPGPTLEKSADLLSILSDLKAGDVLFVDEIHRLNPAIEEALYPAMEDFQVQLIIGEGNAAQSITLDLEKFTLIGATTQPGKLTGPLRDRFGIHMGLDFYDREEMECILERSSKILEIELKKSDIQAVAARSRGTPRIGNRLICRVRDFVEVMDGKDSEMGLSTRAQGVLASRSRNSREEKLSSVDIVNWALDFLEVDHRGLQVLDRKYLEVLAKQFGGGPAGVEALAASLSEDRSTLEETIEPYLLKEGLIVRTARGRQITDEAYRHLNLKTQLDSRPSPDLFSTAELLEEEV